MSATYLSPPQPPKPPSLVVTIFSMFARHIISSLVGVGIAAGAVQEDERTQAVTIGLSVAVWALNAGWGWWQSRKHAQIAQARVVAAAQTGVVK